MTAYETPLAPAVSRATARHRPTNHLWRVVMEVPGVGVELEDAERRTTYATWVDWTNGNIWSRP